MVILQILELINQLRPLTLYLGDVSLILRKKLQMDKSIYSSVAIFLPQNKEYLR